MKLAEMEKFVGDEPTISYVGIRGDEEREGYVSTKPNIQAIFPFRKNIWSLDVINQFLSPKNAEKVRSIYLQVCPDNLVDPILKVLDTPLTRDFYYSKKLNALLDIDVKVFNKAVYEYLKTTDLPVGQLDEFPLIDNDDVLVKDDIFSILEDSGVGVPAYYKPVEFEKDGYTWNQHESLSELIKPERVRQIKLDAIKKQEAKKKQGDGTLLGQLDDDEELMCANCFI